MPRSPSFKLKTKVKNRVLSNPLLRKIALLSLSTPLVVDNPIYKYAYQRQIAHTVKAHSAKPQIVQLELTNLCNLRCVNCPNKDKKRKQGFMEMKTYCKIIDECVELGVQNIYLCGLGEPLLHKSLLHMINYAKIKGIGTLTLYTNGILLTPQLGKELINSGLDELNVSIDAATAMTYSKMRPPGNLVVVERNLRNFINLRNRMESTKPLVIAKFMKEATNADEVSLFKRKWKGWADEIFISFPHNWGGATSGGKSEWKRNKKREPCTMPFRFMSILWDGRVSLCCLDDEGKVLLGDTKETSIVEIWHREKLQEIRKIHLDSDFNKIPLCDKCNFKDVWWLY